MTIHIGVDLHQRFCYMTAVNASGKKLRQAQVANEGSALRAWPVAHSSLLFVKFHEIVSSMFRDILSSLG